ncbi:Hint domain-containing protein [Mesobacterium pallidum]|uniref:Hint domain-containing protein n=1 Tax=Mesobacterium pallidum TaxID=2872037 RepID=UPI001EE2FF24|nr:Hint domain-containing protein [Mesobacterium pallidum]
MTWLALATHEMARFHPAGIGCDKPAGSIGASELLPRGSMMIETRISADARPQSLLEFKRMHPWKGRVSVQAIPGGAIALILVQGTDVFHTVLSHGTDRRADVLRITYSWDAPRRWGRLAIERPESEGVVMVETPPPPPLMLEDIRVMAERPRLRRMDRDMIYFAVSDRVEPLGPMPGLTMAAPVAVPGGTRPARDLRPGDLVETRERGAIPVAEVISRVVPAQGSFEPIRLRAPYFGLTRDVVVAPQQRLVIGGSEVEYLFGKESVLVPAQHLVHGSAAVAERGHALVRYTQVLLAGHETLDVMGAPMESFYLGRIRRHPLTHAASLVAHIPRSRLPEHAHSGHRVLAPFEAITLAEARAA